MDILSPLLINGVPLTDVMGQAATATFNENIGEYYTRVEVNAMVGDLENTPVTLTGTYEKPLKDVLRWKDRLSRGVYNGLNFFNNILWVGAGHLPNVAETVMGNIADAQSLLDARMPNSHITFDPTADPTAQSTVAALTMTVDDVTALAAIHGPTSQYALDTTRNQTLEYRFVQNLGRGIAGIVFEHHLADVGKPLGNLEPATVAITSVALGPEEEITDGYYPFILTLAAPFTGSVGDAVTFKLEGLMTPWGEGWSHGAFRVMAVYGNAITINVWTLGPLLGGEGGVNPADFTGGTLSIVDRSTLAGAMQFLAYYIKMYEGFEGRPPLMVVVGSAPSVYLPEGLFNPAIAAYNGHLRQIAAKFGFKFFDLESEAAITKDNIDQLLDELETEWDGAPFGEIFSYVFSQRLNSAWAEYLAEPKFIAPSRIATFNSEDWPNQWRPAFVMFPQEEGGSLTPYIGTPSRYMGGSWSGFSTYYDALPLDFTLVGADHEIRLETEHTIPGGYYGSMVTPINGAEPNYVWRALNGGPAPAVQVEYRGAVGDMTGINLDAAPRIVEIRDVDDMSLGAVILDTDVPGVPVLYVVNKYMDEVPGSRIQIASDGVFEVKMTYINDPSEDGKGELFGSLSFYPDDLADIEVYKAFKYSHSYGAMAHNVAFGAIDANPGTPVPFELWTFYTRAWTNRDIVYFEYRTPGPIGVGRQQVVGGVIASVGTDHYYWNTDEDTIVAVEGFGRYIELTDYITADRKLELDQVGAIEGDYFRIYCPSWYGRAYSWSINDGVGTDNVVIKLKAGEWCEMFYRWGSWILTAHGKLPVEDPNTMKQSAGPQMEFRADSAIIAGEAVALDTTSGRGNYVLPVAGVGKALEVQSLYSLTTATDIRILDVCYNETSGKIGVLYYDNAATNTMYIRCGTVTEAGVINWGTRQTVGSGTGTFNNGKLAINAAGDVFYIAYVGAGNTAYFRAAGISGVSISLGTAITFGAASASILAVFADNVGGNRFIVVTAAGIMTGTLVGTAATAGVFAACVHAGDQNRKVFYDTANKRVVYIGYTGTTVKIRAAVFNGTDTFTPGTEIDTTGVLQAAGLDSSKNLFAVITASTGPNPAQAYLYTFSGSTVTMNRNYYLGFYLSGINSVGNRAVLAWSTRLSRWILVASMGYGPVDGEVANLMAMTVEFTTATTAISTMSPLVSNHYNNQTLNLYANPDADEFAVVYNAPRDYNRYHVLTARKTSGVSSNHEFRDILDQLLHEQVPITNTMNGTARMIQVAGWGLFDFGTLNDPAYTATPHLVPSCYTRRVQLPTDASNAGDWIGIAQNDAAAGDKVNITMRGGISFVQTSRMEYSNLNIGERYFLRGDGKFTAKDTGRPAGVALDYSTLLLDSPNAA